MGDDGSFSSLFRRSRYARTEPFEDSESPQKQQRKELFAVAAVAFAIKHEPDFKRHFLREICGVTRQTSVTVQIERVEWCCAGGKNQPAYEPLLSPANSLVLDSTEFRRTRSDRRALTLNHGAGMSRTPSVLDFGQRVQPEIGPFAVGCCVLCPKECTCTLHHIFALEPQAIYLTEAGGPNR